MQRDNTVQGSRYLRSLVTVLTLMDRMKMSTDSGLENDRWKMENCSLDWIPILFSCFYVFYCLSMYFAKHVWLLVQYIINSISSSEMAVFVMSQ